MKKFLFLLMLMGAPLLAQNTSLFEQGNTAYNEGDYEAAINYYEQVLDNGQTSADLYYNLANSHFKLNNVAPSIYYYEKALQLDPNDEDIRNNLAIAQKRVIDDIQEEERSALGRIWNGIVSIFGYNGWAWAAIVFIVMFSILFVIYYFSRRSIIKRTFFTLSLVCIFFGLICLVFSFQQYNQYNSDDYAIIFSREAAARDEPTLRSDEAFLLHEGTKLQVIETYQDWIKFELANGIQGWMKKSDVRIL